jgi:sugar/nucleoside kinase (ribokinase family)
MILVLGYANVDLIARMPHLPTSGERVTATKIEMFAGGMAANCACAASSLGSEVYFFGSIGNDVYGELLLTDFKRHGVKTNYVSMTRATTKALISVTPNGNRSIISEPFEYHPKNLSRFLENNPHAEFLYVDGYHLVAAKAELELAKSKGLSIYCDLDGTLDTYEKSEVLETMKRVDIVQITPRMVQGLFADSDLTKFLNYVSIAIQTNGSEDVWLCTKEGTQRFAVPNVSAVDTTGAGDTFAGSFLHFYSETRNLKPSIQKAIEQAALVVGMDGARMNTGQGPTKDQQSE